MLTPALVIVVVSLCYLQGTLRKRISNQELELDRLDSQLRVLKRVIGSLQNGSGR